MASVATTLGSIVVVGGREHVDHIAGADEVQQRSVGEMQGHDAGVRARRRLRQPRTEQSHVGEHLAAAGWAGERRPDDLADGGLRTVGNRCGEAFFEPYVVGGQLDAGGQVTRRHHDIGLVAVRIGAQCGDRRQDDERARRHPAGSYGARPVRPPLVDQPAARRRIE